MTEKTIVECDWWKTDGESCKKEVPATESAACPPNWGLLIDGNGKEFHFCPEHARAGFQWCIDGESEGQLLNVSHNYLGESFEEVYAYGDTMSMSISQLIDEPPRDFPEYDPKIMKDGDSTYSTTCTSISLVNISANRLLLFSLMSFLLV